MEMVGEFVNGGGEIVVVWGRARAREGLERERVQGRRERRVVSDFAPVLCRRDLLFIENFEFEKKGFTPISRGVEENDFSLWEGVDGWGRREGGERRSKSGKVERAVLPFVSPHCLVLPCFLALNLSRSNSSARLTSTQLRSSNLRKPRKEGLRTRPKRRGKIRKVASFLFDSTEWGTKVRTKILPSFLPTRSEPSHFCNTPR